MFSVSRPEVSTVSARARVAAGVLVFLLPSLSGSIASGGDVVSKVISAGKLGRTDATGYLVLVRRLRASLVFSTSR